MNVRYFLIGLSLLILMGCEQDSRKPKDVIAENTYVDLLVELQLVRSYAQNAQTDSLLIDSLTKSVFEKYEITGQTFWESHNYYQQFPEKQKTRIDKAIERLKMDQVRATSDTTDSTSAN